MGAVQGGVLPHSQLSSQLLWLEGFEPRSHKAWSNTRRTSLFVGRVTPPKERELPNLLMPWPPIHKISLLSGFNLSPFALIHSRTVPKQHSRVRIVTTAVGKKGEVELGIISVLVTPGPTTPDDLTQQPHIDIK